jgi:hypothetical protein
MKSALAACILLCCNCSVANAWIWHPAYFSRLDIEDAYIYPQGHQYEGRLADNGYTLDNVREGAGQLPQLVTSPAYGAAGYALKFQTLASAAPKDRTEYKHYYGLPFNYNYYFTFALYIPADVPNPSSWQIFAQWYQNGCSSCPTPPLTLNLKPDGNYALIVRNDVDSYKEIYVEPLPRGRWVKFFVQTYFSLNNQGFLRLYVDDAWKADYTGNLGYFSSEGAYNVVSRFGIYRAGANQVFTMYFDEIRTGTNMNEVKIP